MGQIKVYTEWLEKIFGGDLKLECKACGKFFKNEDEFMEHKHGSLIYDLKFKGVKVLYDMDSDNKKRRIT